MHGPAATAPFQRPTDRDAEDQQCQNERERSVDVVLGVGLVEGVRRMTNPGRVD
jgi:hypothetical protein